MGPTSRRRSRQPKWQRDSRARVQLLRSFGTWGATAERETCPDLWPWAWRKKCRPNRTKDSRRELRFCRWDPDDGGVSRWSRPWRRAVPANPHRSRRSPSRRGGRVTGSAEMGCSRSTALARGFRKPPRATLRCLRRGWRLLRRCHHWQEPSCVTGDSNERRLAPCLNLLRSSCNPEEVLKTRLADTPVTDGLRLSNLQSQRVIVAKPHHLPYEK